MAPKPVQRDEGGRIVAGSGSLNPGGRGAAAKRFSEAIGEQTNDGQELYAFWLAVLRDKRASKDHKFTAAKFLTAYWIGKAPQPITGEGGEGPAQFESTDAALLDLFKSAAAAKGTAT